MKKSNQDEYPSTSFFSNYIDKIEDEDILNALSNQSIVAQKLFESLPPDQHSYSYAKGKWSLKEVLGHIIDVERIFAYRALCIARGEKQNLPGFDENEFVANANFAEIPLAQLLLQYKQVRESSLTLFSTFSEEICGRKGYSNGNEITVRTMVSLIAGHEMHHLIILKEKYNIY